MIDHHLSSFVFKINQAEAAGYQYRWQQAASSALSPCLCAASWCGFVQLLPSLIITYLRARNQET
jgi:hypothetical protein